MYALHENVILVNTILTSRPKVKLIVAQITPHVTYNADFFNYNIIIRANLIPKYLALGYQISTVDQYRNFLSNPADPASIDATKFSNRLNHPTNAAYQAMAATWLAGINALSEPPATPAPPIPEVTQSQPPVPPVTQNPPPAQQGPPPAAKITSVNSSNELAYATDVSTKDLLSGLTDANAVHSGWILQSTAQPNRLNDGIHGASFSGTVEGAWAENTGTVSTFNLPATGTRGWDLHKITSIAAWNSAGYGNQNYSVSVKRTGDADYVALADVNFQPFANTAAGASKVTLTYPPGVMVRGVKAIRFTMKATTGVDGRTVYREIDVFGTPTLPR
jgi:hypothetical protein